MGKEDRKKNQKEVVLWAEEPSALFTRWVWDEIVGAAVSVSALVLGV